MRRRPNPPMTAKELQRELLDVLKDPPNAYDFWPFIRDFIEETGLPEDTDEYTITDGPLSGEFMQWVEDNRILEKWFRNDAADVPPKFFFEQAKALPPRTWMIHHSNADLWGFQRGANYERLGLSTHFQRKPEVGDHNTWDDIGLFERVYTFAFLPGDDPAISRFGAPLASQYGDNWYLFRSDAGVRAYHNGDDQWQTIIPSGTEYDFFRLNIGSVLNWQVWVPLERLRPGALEALDEAYGEENERDWDRFGDEIPVSFDDLDELLSFLDEYLISDASRLTVAPPEALKENPMPSKHYARSRRKNAPVSQNPAPHSPEELPPVSANPAGMKKNPADKSNTGLYVTLGILGAGGLLWWLKSKQEKEIAVAEKQVAAAGPTRSLPAAPTSTFQTPSAVTSTAFNPSQPMQSATSIQPGAALLTAAGGGQEVAFSVGLYGLQNNKDIEGRLLKALNSLVMMARQSNTQLPSGSGTIKIEYVWAASPSGAAVALMPTMASVTGPLNRPDFIQPLKTFRYEVPASLAAQPGYASATVDYRIA